MSFLTFTTLLPLFAALPSLVSAHAHVTNININGRTFGGFPSDNPNAAPPQGIAWAVNVPDNSFTRDYSSPDIICHKQATAAKGSAEVAAGDSVEFQWTVWPAHQGPVVDYMAACPGKCEDADKNQLQWFKIAEQGLVSPAGCNERGNSGCFALDKLRQAGNKWSVTIPQELKAGNYVMRHEVINLDFPGQSQNYPACINLVVSGGGSSLPQGVVGTSLYTGQEPGLTFDIYNIKGPDYPIPGPPLATFGGGAGDYYSSPATDSASDSAGNIGSSYSEPAAAPANAPSTDAEAPSAPPPASVEANASGAEVPAATPETAPSSTTEAPSAPAATTAEPTTTTEVAANDGAVYSTTATAITTTIYADATSPAAQIAAAPTGSRGGCGGLQVARRWVA